MQKLVSALLCFIAWGTYAQVSDTSFVRMAYAASVAQYKQTIKGQTYLYNGSEYRPPRQTDDAENPFFESDDWVFGDIIYDKKTFDHVALMYDITTDRVITENYYSGQQIALVSEKLSRFTFGNHVFERENHATLPKEGFYEILYGGNSKAIARRQKLSRETIVSQRLEVKFDSKSKFFVLKNGTYFPVKSKGSLVKLFEDEKQPIKAFIKKNKLKFRGDPSQSIAAVASEYDKLKSSK